MTATLDPLVEMSERFALGRPRFAATVAASDLASAVRPFGLRFAAAPQPITEPDAVDWRLCPDRQILVGRGGTDIVDMTQNTTGPSGDGSSGGGAEEWGPDHHDDEDLPA
jgi:putative ATP-grasp target RiPP